MTISYLKTWPEIERVYRELFMQDSSARLQDVVAVAAVEPRNASAQNSVALYVRSRADVHV